MPQKETSKLRKPLTDWLTARGWRVWRNAQSVFSESGICDLMALRDGVLICIETKSTGKKATKLQERFLRELTEHGCKLAMVVDSLEDAKQRVIDLERMYQIGKVS
jgi:Holliday junction resolvase